MKDQRKQISEKDHLSPAREDSPVDQGSEAGFEDNRPSTAQLQNLRDGIAEHPGQSSPIQPKANKTGLPDQLKSGVENLSGFAMDDVKVHYNSSKPAQLQAHAYAQGTDIHLGPGQEKHLPHEAWHVVQQKQGRVRPTMQMKGKVPVNDDAGLEKEADVMGAKAMGGPQTASASPLQEGGVQGAGVHQMFFDEEGDKQKLKKIHKWILSTDLKAIKRKKRRKAVYDGVYGCLGKEENSAYEAPADQAGRVTNGDFLAQNRVNVVAREYNKTDDSEEEKKLNALYKKLRKGYRPNEDESKFINPIAHESGTYFHIKRPSKIAKTVQALRENAGNQRPLKERLILNINSASVAAGLLEHILAGWEAGEMDWRSRITSAKFLGMSPEARNRKPDLKYDKVVIYYEKSDRESVFAGAGGFVPYNDRNEGISAFYNKLSKGIGVGEEITGRLGNSFTGRRANTIVDWVLETKGWEAVRAMNEDEFVDEVLPIVRGRMLPADVAEGTLPEPMPYTPQLDTEQQNAMLNGLVQGMDKTDIGALLKALETEEIETTTMTINPLNNLN